MLVAFLLSQAPLNRPAAIAVRDHTNMFRYSHTITLLFQYLCSICRTFAAIHQIRGGIGQVDKRQVWNTCLQPSKARHSPSHDTEKKNRNPDTVCIKIAVLLLDSRSIQLCWTGLLIFDMGKSPEYI